MIPVHEVAVSGAGIGGLSLALSLAQQGVNSVVFERRSAWSEQGAGVQLGPNATRRLMGWGLTDALYQCAFFPPSLQVIDGIKGTLLSELPLGERAHSRYGAPYATLLRADLQALLRIKVDQLGLTDVRLGERLLAETVGSIDPFAGKGLGVRGLDERTREQGRVGERQLGSIGVEFSVLGPEGKDEGTQDEGAQDRSHTPLAPHATRHQAQALVGAEGMFSPIRAHHFQQDALHDTGHLAFRALIKRANLPATMRAESVQLFLAPGLHWVQYPVAAGEWLNVVVLLEVGPQVTFHGQDAPAQRSRFLNNPWQENASTLANPSRDLERLLNALGRVHGQLKDMAQWAESWSVWPLYAAQPIQGEADMARGRLCLLGDAAHPMLPYLAQGAGLSIEDAQAFSQSFAFTHLSVPQRLARYAQMRWLRCARVQRRASRNATLFHLRSPLDVFRNVAMQTLGPRLLDLPWLYDY
jgi:salicylate hydroxylase